MTATAAASVAVTSQPTSLNIPWDTLVVYVFYFSFGSADADHFNFIQRSETSVCTQHCNFDLINGISRCVPSVLFGSLSPSLLLCVWMVFFLIYFFFGEVLICVCYPLLLFINLAAFFSISSLGVCVLLLLSLFSIGPSFSPRELALSKQTSAHTIYVYNFRIYWRKQKKRSHIGSPFFFLCSRIERCTYTTHSIKIICTNAVLLPKQTEQNRPTNKTYKHTGNIGANLANIQIAH